MRQLFNHFVGATVLAGLTACGNPPLQNQANQETTSTASFVSGKGKDALPESVRIDLLAFSRLASADLAKNAATLFIATAEARQEAKSGRITPDTCATISDPESKALPVDLKEAYEASVSDEVEYGGETEVGKAKRMKIMSGIISEIEESINIAAQVCNLKYGA